MNRSKRIVLLGASVLIAAVVLVGLAYAGNGPTETIDDFTVGVQEISLKMPANSDVITGVSVLASSSSIGDERDIYVEAFGPEQRRMYVDVIPAGAGSLDFQGGTSVFALARVEWDGADGEANSVDPVGLGGIDLTDGGGNHGFLLVVNASDHQGDLTVEVYSNTLTNVATYTVRIAEEGTGRMDVFMPFDEFSGASSVFTSAGAIVLEINGTLKAGLDLSIDSLVVTTTQKEYGDLPVEDASYSPTPVASYSADILDAYHIPGTLMLGEGVDAETAHQHSWNARGDDEDGDDDEDGVVAVVGAWAEGENGGFLGLTWAGCHIDGDREGCFINAWIDWFGDGHFTDTTETAHASKHIIDNYEPSTFVSGDDIRFNVPDSFLTEMESEPRHVYARFRICETSTGCNVPGTIGNAEIGEIEDYMFTIYETAVQLSEFSAAWEQDAVRVAWETELEIDTVGFNVWRSLTEDGTYVQVNDALIPSASPGSTLGGSYGFVDESVTPGTTYYYKLEELEVGGRRNWYGPTVAEAPLKRLRRSPIPIPIIPPRLRPLLPTPGQ